MPWALEGGRVLRRVLGGVSKKGLSRRHLEGRNTPFKSTTFACAAKQQNKKGTSSKANQEYPAWNAKQNPRQYVSLRFMPFIFAHMFL